jgi:hypothetical protein
VVWYFAKCTFRPGYETGQGDFWRLAVLRTCCATGTRAKVQVAHRTNLNTSDDRLMRHLSLSGESYLALPDIFRMFTGPLLENNLEGWTTRPPCTQSWSLRDDMEAL